MTGKLLFKIDGFPRGGYSEGFLAVQHRDNEEVSGLLDRDGNWIPLPENVLFRDWDAFFQDVPVEVRDGILNVMSVEEKGGHKNFKAGYLRLVINK